MLNSFLVLWNSITKIDCYLEVFGSLKSLFEGITQ